MNKKQLSDRTPFWGPKLTPELKYLQRITNKNLQVNLNKNLFEDILKSLLFSFKSYFTHFNHILLTKKQSLMDSY